MKFWDPYTIVLALCFIVSLSAYFKRASSDKYLKVFPPFLIGTLFIEFIGLYLFTNGKNNVGLYNFFSAFEFCYYMVIISLIITTVFIKNLIRVLVGLYAVISVINIIYIQKINNLHTVTYSLGCLMVVTCCIYYFYELFKFPTSVKLSRTPAFWICSGLLFYYCCTFSLFGFYNYWSGISNLLMKNFFQIITILNVFLYSLFTIAFLCNRTQKYTLLQS
jgi:hypothetical protein